jgi:hypothetical protein
VRPVHTPLHPTSSSRSEALRKSPMWVSIDSRALKEVSRPTNYITSETHPCTALCSATGICQIDTTPMSVEATFTGRHEAFQYTKVSETHLFTDHLPIPPYPLHSIHKVCQEPFALDFCNVKTVAKRLHCVKTIEPGEMSHPGIHIHSKEKHIFHFCETRYTVFNEIFCKCFE